MADTVRHLAPSIIVNWPEDVRDVVTTIEHCYTRNLASRALPPLRMLISLSLRSQLGCTCANGTALLQKPSEKHTIDEDTDLITSSTASRLCNLIITDMQAVPYTEMRGKVT